MTEVKLYLTRKEWERYLAEFNFASIKNNLDIASAEITSLQAKAAVSPSIIDNPPGSPTSAGVPGQIAYDANYLYVCIYTNTWVRASLASWS